MLLFLLALVHLLILPILLLLPVHCRSACCSSRHPLMQWMPCWCSRCCLLVSANSCFRMPGANQRPCQQHRIGTIVRRRIKPCIVLSDTVGNTVAASIAARERPNQDEFGWNCCGGESSGWRMLIFGIQDDKDIFALQLQHRWEKAMHSAHARRWQTCHRLRYHINMRFFIDVFQFWISVGWFWKIYSNVFN